MWKNQVMSSVEYVCIYFNYSIIFYCWESCRGKEFICQCRRHRDVSSIPELETSFVEWNGNPLQYSCLENPLDRGIWQATVHGVAKSRTRLSTRAHTWGPQRFFYWKNSSSPLTLPLVCLTEKWHLFLRRAAISWFHTMQTDLLGRFLAGNLVLVI